MIRLALSPHGFRECARATVVALILAAFIAWYALTAPTGPANLRWLLLAPTLIVWLGSLLFFRDPHRAVPNLEFGEMLSPADGRISLVETVDAHEAVNGEPALVIRIFLSVLDVHINRAPCAARIIDSIHRPGRYLDARDPESARVNESNLILMEPIDGCVSRLGVRQVSGAIARRIVCTAHPGDRIAAGQRIGLIKYGSTTELILPASARPVARVTVGQRVSAGVTLLVVVPRTESQPAP